VTRASPGRPAQRVRADRIDAATPAARFFGGRKVGKQRLFFETRRAILGGSCSKGAAGAVSESKQQETCMFVVGPGMECEGAMAWLSVNAPRGAMEAGTR
jgi:hypothetical protein